jgi:hypothetical protein
MNYLEFRPKLANFFRKQRVCVLESHPFRHRFHCDDKGVSKKGGRCAAPVSEITGVIWRALGRRRFRRNDFWTKDTNKKTCPFQARRGIESSGGASTTLTLLLAAESAKF